MSCAIWMGPSWRCGTTIASRSSGSGWMRMTGRRGRCWIITGRADARCWMWTRATIRPTECFRRFAWRWRRMIVRKTAAELEKMRRSGLLVWQILQKLKEISVEGASTMDLEVAAEKMVADAGARPAFKGYYVPAAGEHYRFVLCTSVNSEIVHGMPNSKRLLKNG